MEIVCRALAAREAPQLELVVDSAGTAGYHVGAPADPRSLAAALRRGYDLSAHRARQVQDGDFAAFDLLLAMDEANLDELRARAPATAVRRVVRFLDYAALADRIDVPDPYLGGPADFDRVIDLAEIGVRALLHALRAQSSRPRSRL